MQGIFPNLKIVVEEKADGLYKVVGGASIVAKTKRDQMLDEHTFDEVNMTKPLTGFGSGYVGWFRLIIELLLIFRSRNHALFVRGVRSCFWLQHTGTFLLEEHRKGRRRKHG